MLSESVDRLPGKCLTFYARVKVQVKKKYACEQIIILWGELNNFSRNKGVEHCKLH